jgi:hypothetical protein
MTRSTRAQHTTNGNASTRRHRQRKMEEGTTDSNGNTPIRLQHKRFTALIQISDLDLKKKSMSTLPQITVAPSIYTAIATQRHQHRITFRKQHHGISNVANIDLTHLLPKLASYTASDTRMQQCGAKLEVATRTRQIWQGNPAVSNHQSAINDTETTTETEPRTQVGNATARPAAEDISNSGDTRQRASRTTTTDAATSHTEPSPPPNNDRSNVLPQNTTQHRGNDNRQ